MSQLAAAPLEAQDWEARLRAALDPLPSLAAQARRRGDHDLNAGPRAPAGPLRDAAVLAPVIRRPQGWTMLFTVRAADMPTHAGQVAFPGGRLQPEDPDLLACALRETEEEIGVGARFIEPPGAIESYETVTGFLVRPIIGLVDPGFELRPDPREVAEVFEAPLSLVLDPAAMEMRETVWRGAPRRYYAIPFGERLIWGATAGMIKALQDRLT